MKSVSSFFAVVLLSTVSTAAWSADLEGSVPPSADAGWIATVGAKLTVSPDWPGADEYSFFAYPVLGLRRAGDPEPYTALDDGAGFGITVTDWLRVGLAGDWVDSRDKGDDNKLKGLKPIDWAVEVGGFVELWPTDWLRARVELRQGFNGHHGLVADVGLDAIVPIAENLSLAVGPRVALADGDYMRTYYGVTKKEAAKSPVIGKAYRPDGGIESAGVAAGLTYKWSDSWSTTVGGGWNRLVDDAADSPIVKRIGSENQFWGGIRVAYSFGLSGF